MLTDVSESWAFTYDKLKGFITGGREHGIEFSQGADAQPITRRMCMNVEHYFSSSHTGGFFVPRYKAPVSLERTGDSRFRINIDPYEDWRIHVLIDISLLPERKVAVRYNFSFERDYADFEAFISNYFHEDTPPYIHIDGEWQRVKISPGEHRFWARSPEDAAWIDGSREVRNESSREFFATRKANPNELGIDADNYDEPVMVSSIRDTGWHVVHRVDREHCSSFSANTMYTAHDFSLISRDVVKGETVACEATMAYVELEHLDEALTI